VKDGEQIFLCAVSDAQWKTFCEALGLQHIQHLPEYADNNKRVENRPQLLSTLREHLAHRSAKALSELFERVGLPYAPIRAPHELLDDPHLLATGALADITLPDGADAGAKIKTTLLPLTMNGDMLSVRRDPPKLGEGTTSLLTQLGYDESAIQQLKDKRIVA
jgi:crotonobetainyl-CoA:carnitine CoA-transferase CaiB-like acyl-CoA transferase